MGVGLYVVELSSRTHCVAADDDVAGLLVEERADRVVLGGTAVIHGGEVAERLALQVGPVGVDQGDPGGHGRSIGAALVGSRVERSTRRSAAEGPGAAPGGRDGARRTGRTAAIAGCIRIQVNESQMDDAADVVERKFGGFVTATLIAVSRVPPGPNLTCVSRVQKDGEGFSPRIKMEIRIRAPLSGHRPIGDF
jgi:hypothetical protein